MKRILTALGILATTSLALFTFSVQTASVPSQSFGATNTNQLIGGFPYFLAGSGISSSATSITLTSFTLPQTGYEILTSDVGQPFYITFEPGNTGRQEFASCTTVTQSASNATAVLSGCTRGLLPISPYTSNGSYAFSHSGGTTLILSNSPQFYQQFYALGNVSTSTNILNFSSTTPPRYDSVAAQASGTYIATTSELASVAYVNAVTTSGAPNASTAVKGIVQIATAAQVAAGTGTGTSGALLVSPNSLATSTPTASCTTACIVAAVSGKIAQAFLDLTQSFTFSGGFMSTASSTLVATTTIGASNPLSNALRLNGVSYGFPSSQGALGTVLRNNGSGTLTWSGAPRYNYATTTLSAVPAGGAATSTALVIPAGVLTASSTITFSGGGDQTGNGGGCSFLLRKSTDSTTLANQGLGTPGNGVTWHSIWSGTVISDNSTSAQTFVGQHTSLNEGSISSIAVGVADVDTGTSAVDFTASLSLVGVVKCSGTATANFSGLTITVNP